MIGEDWLRRVVWGERIVNYYQSMLRDEISSISGGADESLECVACIFREDGGRRRRRLTDTTTLMFFDNWIFFNFHHHISPALRTWCVVDVHCVIMARALMSSSPPPEHHVEWKKCRLIEFGSSWERGDELAVDRSRCVPWDYFWYWSKQMIFKRRQKCL